MKLCKSLFVVLALVMCAASVHALPSPLPEGAGIHLMSPAGIHPDEFVQTGYFGLLSEFTGTYTWLKFNTSAFSPAFRLSLDSLGGPLGYHLIYDPRYNEQNLPTNEWRPESFGQTEGFWWLSAPGELPRPLPPRTLGQWFNNAFLGEMFEESFVSTLSFALDSDEFGAEALIGMVHAGGPSAQEVWAFNDMPTGPDGTYIPEPATVVLLGLAAGALAVRRRRRR